MKERPYTMSNRAAAAEQTGARILDAMLARFGALPYDQIRIEDIASDAGVTVQTVLRRFGSKPGLMTTMAERELAAIAATRSQADNQDPGQILTDLVLHYEKYGSLILKVYAEAPFVAGLPELAAAGRSFHVEWCRQAFAPHLSSQRGSKARARNEAQVVVACDASTWRILRADLALDPEQTRLTIEQLLRPALRPEAFG